MGTARQDMSETALARSNVYALLATVFRAEPSAAFLTEMRESGFLQALKALDTGAEEDLGPDLAGQSPEDLATEYARLFIGPKQHISPHESVHAEADGRGGGLWGPRTVQVKKFIEAAGLQYDDDFTGLPDHISAELEFVHKLARWEAQKWSENKTDDARHCLGIQKRFMDEHLMQWVPGFCDKVAQAAERPFYGKMAKVTKAFIAYDMETINECLSPEA